MQGECDEQAPEGLLEAVWCLHPVSSTGRYLSSVEGDTVTMPDITGTIPRVFDFHSQPNTVPLQHLEDSKDRSQFQVAMESDVEVGSHR